MKRVFIPAGGARGGLARMLLDIVGPDRAGEIDMVTHPRIGFMVPEDVAVEYRRRTCPPPAPEPTPTPVPAPPAPTVKTNHTPIPAPMVPAQVPATKPARKTRKGGVTGG
jgi:hypothetical protein